MNTGAILETRRKIKEIGLGPNLFGHPRPNSSPRPNCTIKFGHPPHPNVQSVNS
jgi:hypothetical protein